MVEAARLLVEVVPFCCAVVAAVSAGLPPKRPLVAGAAVVEMPDVPVVEAWAAVLLDAGAVVLAAEEPPNRPPLAGAEVAAGADVAGAAPNRPLAGAADVVAVDEGADEAAAPPNRPPLAGLLLAMAANGLDTAELAGAAVLAAAGAAGAGGFAPNRPDAGAGEAVAGCDVAVEAPPKRPPPGAEAGAASGFLPNRPPALALALLSFAGPPNGDDAAGAAGGAAELVLPNMPPADGCAAGAAPPKRLDFGACACCWPKADGAAEPAWAGCEGFCVVLDAAGAPAGVVDPRAPNIDGFAGVA